MDLYLHCSFDDIEDLAVTSQIQVRQVREEVLTYVLSFVFFIAFSQCLLISSCPAAVKSPSPKIFVNPQPPDGRFTKCTFLEVMVRPAGEVELQTLQIHEKKTHACVPPPLSSHTQVLSLEMQYCRPPGAPQELS